MDAAAKGEVNVQSVDRALDILLCLSDENELGPTAIGERLGLHKSTVYRLLRSLESRGFAYKDPGTDRYRVGAAALRVTQRLVLRPDLASAARPELEALRSSSTETAVLDIRVGHARVCIAQAESHNEIKRAQRIGYPMEIYAGAIGKILLMNDDADQLADMASKIPMRRLTRRTPLTVEVLRRQIEQARRDGYALSLGERVEGATTIAVPVRDGSGALVAALAVTGPTYRFGTARARAVLPHLIEAAQRLGARL